jgi:hypothetical protein
VGRAGSARRDRGSWPTVTLTHKRGSHTGRGSHSLLSSLQIRLKAPTTANAADMRNILSRSNTTHANSSGSSGRSCSTTTSRRLCASDQGALVLLGGAVTRI